MTRKTVRSALVVLAVAAAAAACGGNGSDSETPAPGGSDEFAGAIPDASMLAVDLESDGQALTSEEQGLEGEQGTLRQDAKNLAQGINKMIHDTHDGIEQAIAGREPLVLQRGDTTCGIWEYDWANAHWQVIACEKDAFAQRYAFVLRGRPAASTSDDDYLPVFAGEGAKLPAWEGRRRGAGVIFYDFDNLATLTGVATTGKLAIGYRAAGRARQLVLGFKDVTFPESTQQVSALYKYTHFIGVGGRFSFMVNADFLTRDATSNEVVEGQDGVAENALAVIAWRRDLAARAVMAVCGGTLGEGVCFRIAQCYAPDDTIVHEEGTLNLAEPIAWDPVSCPDLVADLLTDDAPTEGDFQLPPDGSDPDVQAPGVSEPDPLPGEDG